MSTSFWFTPKIRNADSQSQKYAYPSSKVVCVGRNYAAHAAELNNPLPKEPLLFIKPNSSLCDFSKGVQLPQSNEVCHHELEVAVLIGKIAKSVEPDESRSYIAGIGLALDLTLRAVQESLKKQGHPWEKAKAFDGACPVTDFVPFDDSIDLVNIHFALTVNGEQRQVGDTQQMIFSINQLVSEMSRHFTLYPGDILLTGTPKGVGPLNSGDQLNLVLNNYQWQSQVK